MNNIQELALQPMNYDMHAPTRDWCYSIWEEYAMPQHIRNHCTQVAYIAECIAQALAIKDYPLCISSIVASALLHDIAKMYCIENPTYRHNEIGALWILNKTGHIPIAQGIYYHNYLNPADVTLPYNILPVIVMYADSRVCHSDIVSLDERYKDLTHRYGTTEERVQHIALVKTQAQTMEQWLTTLLGCAPDITFLS